MPGRFLPQRDLDVFTRVNKELIGDIRLGKDGIINQQVVLYKVSAHDTQTNLYGEATSGKRWKDGVKFACLVDAEDFLNENNAGTCAASGEGCVGFKCAAFDCVDGGHGHFPDTRNPMPMRFTLSR